ncbi:MAG TPA: hypothetical protein PLA85_01945 [Micropepsaceae bacterium]|nr:hypothetical protein [Micropepsaceae bacterium]
MLEGAIIGAVVGLTLAIIGYFIAAAKKGAEWLAKMPDRVSTFTVRGAPDAVYRAILAAKGDGKAEVDSTDDVMKRMVLTHKPSMWAGWGFFMPIHISAQGGSTEVKVGFTSRFIQKGPLVTRAHNAFTDAVKKVAEAA